ncbi:MAG: capsular polysaccharide biosynthesis protein [Eubacterium sp.]|nr:capsular polysaccharide biosynthesis protein [Eubacterium sp.]
MPVIDFHSHILPGIDDGSKDVETSLRMLDMAASQGVDLMIATPHFYASRHRVEEFLPRREASWNRLKEGLAHHEGKVPDILLGAEVAFFRGISQADKIGAMTVGDSDIMLLEMHFEPWTDRDIKEVRDLVLDRHFTIILAHLERYMDIGQNRRRYADLFDLPLYVQINAESISGGKLRDWRRRKTLINMFKDGQAHLLGSDCHGIHHRLPNLIAGRNALKEKLGEAYLKKLDERGSNLLGLKGDTHV